MNTFWPTVAITLLMALTNVLGATSLKLSVDPDKHTFFAIGIAAYVFGAVLYVKLLKEHSLAVLAVASSTLQLGLMIALSIWFFDERVNTVQSAAMLTAVVATTVVLLAATK